MLLNTTEFSRSELRELFGAENTFNLPEFTKGISTDTRTLEHGNIFVALKGERFDGHDVLSYACEKGASVLIVDRKYEDKLSTEIKSYPHIYVENTLAALGMFGQFHRNRLAVKVIAIAGAAGKTSTKDLAAHLLSQKFSTLKTEANYNNKIGVPLTLLQLTPEHEVAVIEIGTNEPGEIEILSRLCNPTHGLITNIGKEHLEKLIDLDGVEREEIALFSELSENGGQILLNMDDERLRKYAAIYPNALFFGIEHQAQVQTAISFNGELQPALTFMKNGFTVQMQTIGLAAAYNAIAAAAVGISLGMNGEEIRLGLESFVAPEAHGYGRMNIESVGGCTLINDCYNANPESMLIALRTLKLFPTSGKRIAVLGDMRELGESAREEHKTIIAEALSKADEVVVLGDEMGTAANHFSRVRIAASKGECIKMIEEIITNGDVVLVKGSRGMQMEDIITGLKHNAGVIVL